MSENSKIEWTDATFNPWIGCTKVSPACDHCYAEVSTPARVLGVTWGAKENRHRTSAANWKLAERWNREKFFECAACGWRGEEKDSKACEFGHDYPHRHCPNSACHTTEVLTPARRRVFCASLADVFDNQVDPAWRADLFDLIERTPNLDWLLLTKRIGNVPAMMLEVAQHLFWMDRLETPSMPDSVWLGATICNQDEADRDVPKLLAVPARVRFLSVEPLLGPIRLPHDAPSPIPFYCDARDRGIDWVIAGGESGPHARPRHPAWARSLRDQCAAADVPFLYKQNGEWADGSGDFGAGRFETAAVALDGRVVPGGYDAVAYPNGATAADGWAMVHRAGKKAAGRLLDGVQHDGFPPSNPPQEGNI